MTISALPRFGCAAQPVQFGQQAPARPQFGNNKGCDGDVCDCAPQAEEGKQQPNKKFGKTDLIRLTHYLNENVAAAILGALTILQKLFGG